MRPKKYSASKLNRDKKWADLDSKFEELKKTAAQNSLHKPLKKIDFELILREQLRGLSTKFQLTFASKDDVKTVDKKIDVLDKKFDKLFERLDWFTGKYTQFEEEQKLLSGKTAEFEERMEKIEERVGIVIQ